MSSPDRILDTLVPPAGGWQRLLHRRATRTPWLMPIAALASTAVAVLAFLWPYSHPIQLQLNGARLIGEVSRGATLRMLDNHKVVEVPSGDPNVRVYWIKPGGDSPSNQGGSPAPD